MELIINENIQDQKMIEVLKRIKLYTDASDYQIKRIYNGIKDFWQPIVIEKQVDKIIIKEVYIYKKDGIEDFHDQFCKIKLINPEELLKPNRKKELVALRAEFCFHARQMGYTLQSIADVYSFTHSSVINLIRLYNNLQK